MQTIEIFHVLVATIYKSADGRKKVTIVMVMIMKNKILGVVIALRLSPSQSVLFK